MLYIIVFNTHVSPSVGLSSNHQNTYWGNMATMSWEAISLKGAIFLTISPFLVIDDNTTKASKINCKNMKLIPIWKVRNYLACSDDISMLILKATGIWLVHRTKYFRLDSNCETMACGQCKTIVWFEPYEQWKNLYLSPWDHQIALLPPHWLSTSPYHHASFCVAFFIPSPC